MSSLDGEDIFGSGPHTIRTGPWQRCLQRRGFAGIDGEQHSGPSVSDQAPK